MDPEKLKEIKQGKKHMAEEGSSSAAESTTPMSKLAGGGPPAQKKPAPKYKPKFDPLTLSMAIGAATGVDDDAIGVEIGRAHV